MNRDAHRQNTDTSQKIMDRIKDENRWNLPVHEHESAVSKRLRTISSIIAIILLVGISVSFIFLNPTSPKAALSPPQNENVETIIKSTDFAKSFSNLDFTVVQEGMIASIGEPLIYQPQEVKKHKLQIFWVLSILAISMITLFMSWLSNEDNDSTTLE